MADDPNDDCVKTSYFGDVVMDGADVALMDGGIHGVQGHSLYVGPGRGARWQRRVDGLAPQGVAGAGTLELSADERAWLDEQIARARALAASGATRFFGDGPPAPPRWVWAIALRCAGGVRVLEGGGRDTRSAPPGLAPLLAWLRDRVDREANGRPARRRGGLREALAAAARGVARAARFRR